VQYRSVNGLVLAEHGMDAADIERELRKRDPLLSLQGWPSLKHGCILWRVVRDAGPDRPPERVYRWQSESGEPYPLSSGLLDGFDRHDRNNSRRDYKSDDEYERERQAELMRQQERDDEAIADDWSFKHGRPLLPRSQSLRIARDKRRAQGEKC